MSTVCAVNGTPASRLIFGAACLVVKDLPVGHRRGFPSAMAAATFPLLDRFTQAGGNFIDTSNVYRFESGFSLSLYPFIFPFNSLFFFALLPSLLSYLCVLQRW